MATEVKRLHLLLCKRTTNECHGNQVMGGKKEGGNQTLGKTISHFDLDCFFMNSSIHTLTSSFSVNSIFWLIRLENEICPSDRRHDIYLLIHTCSSYQARVSGFVSDCRQQLNHVSYVSSYPVFLLHWRDKCWNYRHLFRSV